jgi:Helix-turn-helix domain
MTPLDKFGTRPHLRPWGHTGPTPEEERFMSKESPLTISVPEAGEKYFGLSRNGAYDAAARGEIPTIKIGRLLRVPIRALEAMLDRASEPAA